jgi:queuine tRNA-ribosyltransferase
MPGLRFDIHSTDTTTKARSGTVTTAHGPFDTPAFMPVGTVGSIKGIPPWEVERTGSRILLANTYHLYLRPGMEVVTRLGGLHRMMDWKGSILTDSGGYQVFSLSALMKVEEEGATFRSHLDGSKHQLTPEKAVEIQETLGSDIMMVLDECPRADLDREEARRSMELTTRWARRGLAARKGTHALFGIAQGGMHPDLRRAHAEELAGCPFEGLAVGGLSVGEEKETTQAMLAASLSGMPGDRPRYLMGVGRPGDILRAVALGVDMFDCVLPTRSGRTGLLFTSRGEVSVKQTRYRLDDGPVDPECSCPTCARFSAAYLRHLYVAGEMLGPVLNTLHNLHFYQGLMRRIREAIAQGGFPQFMRAALETMDRKAE